MKLNNLGYLLKEGFRLNRMLIVTFTNAAAGEMRLRIGSALEQAARERHVCRLTGEVR